MELLKQNRMIAIIAGVVVAVVVVGVGVVALTGSSAAATPYARYADVAYERLEDGGFVLGDPDAPITLVEFGDFACPHCQAYFEETERFIDEFVLTGKARFEYRMFISGADPTYGPYTARLAECASSQREGAFWPAHDVLFEIGRAQSRFNERTARTLADRLELNYSDLLSCAEDAGQVDFDVRLGQGLNVQSTPTMMIRFGDGDPQFISDGVQTYDGGGVPYVVLQAIVTSAQ